MRLPCSATSSTIQAFTQQQQQFSAMTETAHLRQGAARALRFRLPLRSSKISTANFRPSRNDLPFIAMLKVAARLFVQTHRLISSRFAAARLIIAVQHAGGVRIPVFILRMCILQMRTSKTFAASHSPTAQGVFFLDGNGYAYG
jgi:hypothetical protein